MSELSTAEAFDGEYDGPPSPEPLGLAPDVVEVRRNGGLAALVDVLAEDPMRGLLYLVMPILTLFLHETGVILRMARASTLEVLRQRQSA